MYYRHNINSTHLDSDHVPAELKEVLTRLIAERRAERYQSALEVLEDLKMLAVLID